MFIKISKKAVANAVEKGLPILAVVLSGAITYSAFSKEATNLKDYLEKHPYC